jgi:sulfate permease, SulP family
LDVPGQPSDNSLAQLVGVVRELHAARLEPVLLGTLVVFAAALSSRWAPLLPAPLVGVALAGVAAQLFPHRVAELGPLELAVPPLVSFSWNPEDARTVLPRGLGLAFVASVNLLLASRVAEHFCGRHQNLKRSDADRELGAYGIANMCAGIFGAPMSVGIPARSLALANVRCGATSRTSNIMHAVFLIALVRLGSGVLVHIPLAALAGVTAWMSLCLLDWSAWHRLLRMRPVDSGAFLVTAFGVVMVNAVAGCDRLFAVRSP